MTIVLLALVLAAQNPLPPAPPPNQTPPPREPSAAHAIIDQEADTAQARAEAREILNAFGRCVARASAAMAEETLVMDFTSRAYRSRLRQMADNNRESCFRRAGRMRMDGLLLAGGIAEELLARDPAPLNTRLARAALGPATPAFSVSDAIAVCVVRSVPDDVARLFATEVASEAEAEALAAVSPIVAACNRTGHPFSASHPGLRAILATAAFRSVRTASAVQGSGQR